MGKMIAIWRASGTTCSTACFTEEPLVPQEEPVLDEETVWLSPRKRAQVVRLANAIGVLLSVHPTMPLQLAMTFLAVAADEGLTVTALATKRGVGTSIMSRHLQDLGSVNRHKKPGLGLVITVQREHGDRREYQVFLTEHGTAVLRRMKANCLTGPTWRIFPVAHKDWSSAPE